MRTIESVAGLRAALAEARSEGKLIGFVPTMGFLHQGHLDLMRRAHSETDFVVISIFVNPLQFGPQEDFARYPRDMQRDSELAKGAGVDLLFAPELEEMYPVGDLATRVTVGRIGEVGEGRYRPGHFDGVATVCTKLFGMISPARCYFGEKDAQQLAVIRQIVRDLNIDVAIVGCPTTREEDGLAMSSRNKYLSDDQRRAAAILNRGLTQAAAVFATGERRADRLESVVREVVGEEPKVELQYVEACDSVTFERVEVASEGTVVQLAAFLGPTRLIDNITLS